MAAFPALALTRDVDPRLTYSATVDAMLARLQQDLERVADLGAEGRSIEEVSGEGHSATNRTGLEGLRAATEMLDTRTAAVDREGVRLRFRGTAPEDWLTPFGEMRVERRIYAGTGTAAIAPLDARCAITGRCMAPQLE